MCAEKCGERLGYTLRGAGDGELNRLREERGEGMGQC